MAIRKSDDMVVTLEPLTIMRAEIPVIGASPLIVHRWSEKAKRMMLDAQQGKKKVKQVRDPDADFQSSMYRFDDGAHGVPAVSFKAATVGGARYFSGVSMAELKPMLYFHGEGPDQLVRLACSEPVMREDPVRVGMTTDLRYRAQYDQWAALLDIEFPAGRMSLDSVISLVQAGGMGGIGEWRPSGKTGAGGPYGRFTVDIPNIRVIA
jgi:hypothetical protein